MQHRSHHTFWTSWLCGHNPRLLPFRAPILKKPTQNNSNTRRNTRHSSLIAESTAGCPRKPMPENRGAEEELQDADTRQTHTHTPPHAATWAHLQLPFPKEFESTSRKAPSLREVLTPLGATHAEHFLQEEPSCNRSARRAVLDRHTAEHNMTAAAAPRRVRAGPAPDGRTSPPGLGPTASRHSAPREPGRARRRATEVLKRGGQRRERRPRRRSAAHSERFLPRPPSKGSGFHRGDRQRGETRREPGTAPPRLPALSTRRGHLLTWAGQRPPERRLR